MDLDQLLALGPRLHHDGEGNAVSWGLAEPALRFIEQHVDDGARTVETGEGVSTVLLAAKGCTHTVVSPNYVVFNAIREFCEEHDISLDSVEFVQDFSERALPRLDLNALEFALIDGGHGFPTPFIDWFNVALSLAPGGLVLIDDVNLWTGATLRDFLASEHDDWTLVADWPGRACAFEKLTDSEPFSEWTEQPFVRDRMNGNAQPKGRLRTLVRRLGRH